VWEFARAKGFIIVSKDADFHQRSLVLGHPPKVIWIRRGNCTTATVVSLLRINRDQVEEFIDDPAAGFLTID
jgi:predicted nuclease of predicted toxin-antitoxin system